jgi:hypothetical protein
MSQYFSLEYAKQLFEGGLAKLKLTDNSGNTLLPSGEILRLEKEIIRPNDTIAYAVGDAVGNGSMIVFENSNLNTNSSGFIHEATIETKCTAFAGATIRLWLYNAAITPVIADNAAFINSYANTGKRIGLNYLDVTFDPLLAGSDTVFGRVQFPTAVHLSNGKLYALMQTLTAVIPSALCEFNIKINFLKLT